MGYQSHVPVPDSTGTYCTVEGCKRFLGRDARQHRRGARYRYGEEPPAKLRRLKVSDVNARLDRIEEALLALANRPVVSKTNVDKNFLAEIFYEAVEPIAQELDEIKTLIRRTHDVPDSLTLSSRPSVRIRSLG
jgi:hypothetical protein